MFIEVLSLPASSSGRHEMLTGLHRTLIVGRLTRYGTAGDQQTGAAADIKLIR